MKGKYITARCPVCESISLIKAAGVMIDTFICPVCLDGVISRYNKIPAAHRVGSRSPKASPVLVAT
jgi:hypothetical protein